MAWHMYERENLARLLHEAGPNGPTLCEGWRTRHLAVHLVQREHAAIRGAMSFALPARRRAAAMDEAAARVADRVAYHDLVDRFAREPARLSPAAWAGDAVNLIEYFVHGEDVRRAVSLNAPTTPEARDLPPGEANALWDRFGSFSRLLMLTSDVGVVFVLPDGRRIVTKARRAGAGASPVVVRGEVGELVLFASGRGARSHVDLAGDPDQIDALTQKYPAPAPIV